MSNPDIECISEGFLDPELLEFDLAALLDLSLPLARFGIFLLDGGAGPGVFEFYLGLHGPALSEIVAQIDHGVRNVKATVAAVIPVIGRMGIAVDVVTVEITAHSHFPVATDSESTFS